MIRHIILFILGILWIITPIIMWYISKEKLQKQAVEILNQTEGYQHYDRFMEGRAMIDSIVNKAQKHVEKRAKQFAVNHKDDNVIYTMASGASWGAAYLQSICIFQR